jgi:hypothetical protein
MHALSDEQVTQTALAECSGGAAVEQLIATMRLYSGSSTILSVALSIAWNTTVTMDNARKVVIMASTGSGLIEAVIVVLQKTNDAMIAELGMGTLCNMAAVPEAKATLVKVGGIDVAIKLMPKFAAMNGVQQQIAGFMWNMCIGGTETIREAVCVPGSIEGLVAALKAHSKDMRLCSWACGALRSLC